MKTFASLYCCIGIILCAGCTSGRYVDAVPGVYDLTPKNTLKTDTLKTEAIAPEINEDTTMLLSEKAKLMKNNTKPPIDKMQNFFSLHVGTGSMGVKVTGQPWYTDRGRITVHFDYEHYFKNASGLGIGIFYMIYGENGSDYYGNDIDLTLLGLGPQLVYKIKWRRLLVGANFGAGIGIMSTFSNYFDNRNGWQDDSRTTVGGTVSAGVGIELLLTNRWSISLKYNHLRGYFSDTDFFATKDGKLSCKRDAFLIGTGFYF